jgi:hypothetical protein
VRAAIKREEQTEARAASLLDRIEDLYGEAREVLEQAKSERKGAISINAIREMRSTLELIGRLTGELQERPTTVINVTQSNEWLVVREAVFEVLDRHPAAAVEVAARLDAIEARPGSGQEAG